jgi:hypothetical protein
MKADKIITIASTNTKTESFHVFSVIFFTPETPVNEPINEIIPNTRAHPKFNYLAIANKIELAKQV